MIAYWSFSVRFGLVLASLVVELDVRVVEVETSVGRSKSSEALWTSVPVVLFIAAPFAQAVLSTVEFLESALLGVLILPVRRGCGSRDRSAGRSCNCRCSSAKVIGSASSSSGSSVVDGFLAKLPGFFIDFDTEGTELCIVGRVNGACSSDVVSHSILHLEEAGCGHGCLIDA